MRLSRNPFLDLRQSQFKGLLNSLKKNLMVIYFFVVLKNYVI
jgi:hypothetical protein